MGVYLHQKTDGSYYYEHHGRQVINQHSDRQLKRRGDKPVYVLLKKRLAVCLCHQIASEWKSPYNTAPTETVMERVFEALSPMMIKKPAKNGAATINPAFSTNHFN